MHFLVWKFLLYIAHHLRTSHVAMPRHGVHVFLEAGPGELIEGAAKQIVIMVEGPDFRGARFEQRAEGCYQALLVLFGPRARRHSATLVGVDLVLSGHRADFHARCRVLLHEPLKVSGVGRNIFRPNVSAQHGVAVLHPSWRTPG